MKGVAGFFTKSIGVYNVKGLEIEPRIWQAVAIGVLLFLLVFTLARLRYLYVHWNLSKNSLSFLFYGFILALILEGFLIISGKSLLIEVIGWKNPPKLISTALDIGKEKLINVLGMEDEIELNKEESPTFQSVIIDYKKLSSDDSELVREYLCRP